MEIQTRDIFAGMFSSGVRQTAESVSGAEAVQHYSEIQLDTFIDPKSSN